ncbi:MAG: hypothetical protein ACRYG8_51515 [Janthinobacterium lividum]
MIALRSALLAAQDTAIDEGIAGMIEVDHGSYEDPGAVRVRRPDCRGCTRPAL